MKKLLCCFLIFIVFFVLAACQNKADAEYHVSSYNGEKLAQGKEAVRSKLESNRELYDEIEQKVRLAASDKSDMIEIDATTDDEDAED